MLPFMLTAGTLPNPFTITARSGDYTSTTGRTTSTFTLDPSENTGLFLVVGDSLFCNNSDSPYNATSNKIDQINILDHSIYVARDPALGVSNSAGCMLTRLQQKLVDNGVFDRVIVVNSSSGGLATADYVPTGTWVQKLETGIACTRLIAQPVDAVLMQFGTNDAAFGYTTTEFKDNFNSIIAYIRGHNISAPIYMTKATYSLGTTYDDFRTAFDELVDEANNVFLGPDIDPPVIPTSQRRDDIHPNNIGEDHFANLYLDILTEKFT